MSTPGEIAFIDSSIPLTHVITGVQGVAGYIGGDTPHVWTLAEWNSQPYQYRLPIFVRSNPVVSDIPGDVTECLKALASLAAPKGTLVALDSETSIDQSYVVPFVVAVNAAGYRVIDYGSQNDVFGNNNPDGYYWGAQWTGQPHIAANDQMTQYVSFTGYDESVGEATLPFWNTHVADPPAGTNDVPPGQWLNAKNWSWQEAVIIGRGLDNNLYEFAFDPATGTWHSVPVK